jgi:hypothetical protein
MVQAALGAKYVVVLPVFSVTRDMHGGRVGAADFKKRVATKCRDAIAPAN